MVVRHHEPVSSEKTTLLSQWVRAHIIKIRPFLLFSQLLNLLHPHWAWWLIIISQSVLRKYWIAMVTAKVQNFNYFLPWGDIWYLSLSETSGLSFDSTFLVTLLFFCLVACPLALSVLCFPANGPFSQLFPLFLKYFSSELGFAEQLEDNSW